MITSLEWGKRKTRKPHQCFDCYRKIPVGVQAAFFSGVMDGRAYTLYHHTDCCAAADAWRDWAGYTHYDYGEGYPPLADDLRDCDLQANLDWLRGQFPHVVCRIEFAEQKAAIRMGDWEGV